MPDLDTSRIPRETLAGLIATTSREPDRITAPMPIATLDELLADEQPQPQLEPPAELPQGSTPELVVRFHQPAVGSRHIIVWTFALTMLIAALIFVLV